MPRIDPLQLLKCLGVLLTPSGGIRSKEEVQRLASLMMKFSKKLVSKCVYILILKNTEIDLLGMFMSAGGWTLVLTWLSDGIYGKNWALVIELLELLLMCPVDVERLKSNSIPRLVKGLSKDEGLGRVNFLATKLVDQWLKIVKDETVAPEKDMTQSVVVVKPTEIVVEMQEENAAPEPVEEITVNSKVEAVTPNQLVVIPQQFYKLTVRDGKQIIAKVDNVNINVDKTEPLNEIPIKEVEEVVHVDKKEKDKKDDEKKMSKDRSKHDKNKHKSSSTSKSSSSSTSRDKISNSSNSNSSNSSSSNRDKLKDKERSKDRSRDRDKHRSNGSIKHSSSTSSNTNSSNQSSTSKESKEKQAEKDKDTLAKIQPKSVDKFGRIPKKSSMSEANKNDRKVAEPMPEPRNKPSISIEVRKKDGSERPKTVKVFNSKLRSTGLEEAAKPPPPRPTKKSSVFPVLPAKRPSPSREIPPLPEKRVKMLEPELEKPGGIKLIAPKPKPVFLQESDMFMDALAASATNKKETKKRKRRISKDNSINNPSPPLSPSTSTASLSPLSSPLSLKSITAPKFYKDTLETDESKPEECEDTKNETDEPATKNITPVHQPDEDSIENVVKEINGLKGVLVYHKRRKIKKSVTWRVDSELEDIQYFELDETERVNVTKTFMDMKQMEHVGEREALQLSRKLPNEDLMDERTNWKTLIPIDLPPPLAESGKKSSEKEIQFAREKVILQALYFNRSMLPDSPAEPDPETHQITDPVSIPLDDVTGNPDSINDFQNTPWPEPKGSPLHITSMSAGPPNIFSNMPPFSPQMGPPSYPIMNQQFSNSNYIPPHLMNHGGGGDWRNVPDPSNIASDLNHPPMNPNMYNRQEGYVNMIEENGGGGDAGGRGYPPQGFGPGPMAGPPGPAGPMFPNFSANNRGNNRGGFRNMGRGGWFRPTGPPPVWHRGGGGGMASGNHWGGRGGGGICHQFKMQGFCRQRETCPYMHPQGNGPY